MAGELVPAEAGAVDSIQVDRLIEALLTVTSPAYFIAFLDGGVQTYFDQQIDQNFANEASRDGAWAPLKESTQQRREFYGFPPDHPINIRTGKLEAFAHEKGIIADDGAGVSWTWPGPTSDSWIERKFQTAQAGRGVTPARPIATADADDLANVVELLALGIKASLEAYGSAEGALL